MKGKLFEQRLIKTQKYFKLGENIEDGAGIVVKLTSVKHSVSYMTGNLNISRRC